MQCIPYLLENDYNALLVPRDDPDAMAAAVRRVLTEPGLAAYLARNARQKVEHFDWSIILQSGKHYWPAVFESCNQNNCTIGSLPRLLQG